MKNEAPKTFEEKLDRIDAIVKELESGRTELERAIDLFKEGKTLSRECEAMLKSAQGQIDTAMSGGDAAAKNGAPEDLSDELPF
ncbi:MAG TPA: exodeoxyribonuclease VII small subunit [Candidatus Baltobacteraceae bacterium]|jgi:exodeoxyribonuclease VII small subunit|nr:exodeoxyribonuclease VII small subunit [Candidatus Baltobacteraceae bacterium]